MSGFLIICIFQYVSLSAAVTASNKIHPDLMAALSRDGIANVVVTFKGGIENTLQQATMLQRSVSDRSTRNQAILNSLEKHSDEAQAGVIQLLTTQRSPQYYKTYKSANIVYIKGATRALVDQIADDNKVGNIRKEPIVLHVAQDVSEDVRMTEVTKMHLRSVDKRNNNSAPEWNLQQIQVPEAWEELGGKKGDGVVVGTIDNGANAGHEVLKNSYLGEYGWFDAINHTPTPRDSDGEKSHGTNVMGIIVGSLNIGIAPGAKWMACAACNQKCEYEHLRDCIQWMECPTLPDGSKKDCSKAPHIINNSWVSVRGEDGYNEDILRWRALGIIPVWAISNNGPLCHSTASPAEQPFVIGVGGNTLDTSWYSTSGVGPAPGGGIKPDIVAPGKGVLTCGSGLFKYLWVMGTSIAAPHVAGVLALLMTRNLQLTYEEAYKLLTENTDQECPVNRHRYTCANQSEEAFPNNFCGFGRVNALKAVRAQTKVLLEATNKSSK